MKCDSGALEHREIILKCFSKLETLWKLTTKESTALLGINAKKLEAFKRNKGEISRDVTERVLALVAIKTALMNLIPDKAVAHSWIRDKNTTSVYDGKSPLDFIIAGARMKPDEVKKRLIEMRNYLYLRR